MLPFDFGTTPATDAGIPGLNLDDLHLRPAPARSINGGDYRARRTGTSAPALRRQPLQLPARRRTRSSSSSSATSPSCMGNHTFKFGIDIRRAYNLRVPSDAHRSGELRLQRRTAPAGPTGGGLGAGDLPARRRDELQPLRQHQHGRARAAVAAVLLRAGHLARQPEADAQLRPAARHHQPADGQRAGQRRLARPRHRRDPGWRASATSTWPATSRTSFNWAPRLGATYQLNEKTVIRARLRPQLRHRRVRLDSSATA